jgi:hypothetical protein
VEGESRLKTLVLPDSPFYNGPVTCWRKKKNPKNTSYMMIELKSWVLSEGDNDIFLHILVVRHKYMHNSSRAHCCINLGNDFYQFT